MRGRFITFEGIEGSGKSTQLRRLADQLEHKGVVVVRTREPGVGLGPELRDHVLLRANLHPMSEAFFMAMDRHEHVERIIRPALERGDWVLCDRYVDSTLAYQGGGSGLDSGALHAINGFAVRGVMPDRTLLFDLPVEVALERVRLRARERPLDRFEAEAPAFHQRVRSAYLELARVEPARFVVLDAARSPEQVHADARGRLEDLAG